MVLAHGHFYMLLVHGQWDVGEGFERGSPVCWLAWQRKDLIFSPLTNVGHGFIILHTHTSTPAM